MVVSDVFNVSDTGSDVYNESVVFSEVDVYNKFNVISDVFNEGGVFNLSDVYREDVFRRFIRKVIRKKVIFSDIDVFMKSDVDKK